VADVLAAPKGTLGMLRIAVPDLVTNSFVPVLAAVDLGFFREEGLDASVELLSPLSATFAALRQGDVDLVAGAAHSTLSAFPNWRGAKLLAAVSQHLFWVLVVRKDLGAARGDLDAVKGLRIGGAGGVGADEEAVELAGDVALQAADDRALGQSGGHAARDVGAGAGSHPIRPRASR
jgi:NitT/TauT family transport system substrate-binding protein